MADLLCAVLTAGCLKHGGDQSVKNNNDFTLA
jgi:hypothetical protein